jgi:uncharacterized protein (DUF488 family)
MDRIFTIGHSTHSIDRFIDMLDQHGVDTVGDVRSAPYSRFNPQFSKDAFNRSLRERGKKYVFLGKELGARSDDPACYKDGRVQYEVLAKTDLFQSGIQRLKQGLEKGHVIALVCAEKDPLDCHRTLLVSRELVNQGVKVEHILANGSIETNDQATERLVRQFKLHQNDLFMSDGDVTQKALDKQEERIAYVAGG